MPPLLLACGSNASAQLSIGHSDDVHSFQPCLFHPEVEHLLPSASVLDLVSSSTHSLLLLSTAAHGTRRNLLLGAGTNTMGQLGPRCALWEETRPEGRWKPVDLLGPLGLSHEDWEPVKVAVTWTTSFVVYRNLNNVECRGASAAAPAEGVREIVISCGSNDFGELGMGDSGRVEGHIPTSKASATPTIIELGLGEGEDVEVIKGGQRHVLAVITDARGTQRLMGWGAARKGELDPSTAIGAASSSTSAAAGRASGSTGLKGKGKAVTRPTSLPPTTIELPTGEGQHIVDIALGASHSLVQLSDGRVMGWGSNTKSQITDLHSASEVTGVAATWGGTYLLTRSGELWSQGPNTHSQLLRTGDALRGRFELPKGWRAHKLVAGSEHILVHATLGEGDAEGLFVGGWNEHGNLGQGDTVDRDRLVPVDLQGLGSSVSSGTKILGAWAGCASSWLWVDATK
jgi:protein ATS1